MRIANKIRSICPLRYRGDHKATRPALLTEVSVKHISHQIDKNGYEPLPSKVGEYVYHCRDCDAVWLAASPYIAIPESSVLGIYEKSLIWKPFRK
jgi:hypothetical protein